MVAIPLITDGVARMSIFFDSNLTIRVIPSIAKKHMAEIRTKGTYLLILKAIFCGCTGGL